MKTVIAVTAIIFTLTSLAYSATYYVDGKLGSDTNPGTIERPWKTINKANKTLVAGDIVYIRGGTYEVCNNNVGDGGLDECQGIKPVNSGSPGKMITYSAYPGEVVNFVGIAMEGYNVYCRGIDLDGKSYIHVTGHSDYNMKFTNMVNNLVIGRQKAGHHNEIDHCDFGTFYSGKTPAYHGSLIAHGSTYNHIHDNRFHDWQMYTETWDGPVCLEIGIDNSKDPDTKYNVIENNVMYHSGHHVLGLHGRFNVVRNNIIHNEPYYRRGGALYGYRLMFMSGNSASSGTNLIEGNRLGKTGISMLSSVGPQRGGSGMTLGSSYNIVRYNCFYDNLLHSIYLRAYTGPSNGYGESLANHIYNNTFYHIGYSTEDDAGYDDRFPVVVSRSYEGARLVVKDNVIKNNLFCENWPQTTYPPFDDALPVGTGPNTRPYLASSNPSCPGMVQLVNFKSAGTVRDQVVTNNLEATGPADQVFVNADISDPMSINLPDLRLVPGSLAINSASHLTRAKGSGSNSTILVVEDVRYFQDGNFGQGNLAWPSSVNLNADWIAIGTVGNIVQIQSINYSTNTITLASSMTWSDNDKVWLYKKSDGERVLYGDTPDMGAHEFTEDAGSPPPEPTGLRIQ